MVQVRHLRVIHMLAASWALVAWPKSKNEPRWTSKLNMAGKNQIHILHLVVWSAMSAC